MIRRAISCLFSPWGRLSVDWSLGTDSPIIGIVFITGLDTQLISVQDKKTTQYEKIL